MPANIAHMLIAHKAVKTVKGAKNKKLAAFAEMLDDFRKGRDYRAYVNLGSIGPDLYYYKDLTKVAGDILKEGSAKAKGVTEWAYHLHSHQPNKFPLKLVEIVFTDALKEKGKVKLEPDDIKKIAYIAGHLSHIAADQIIHPLVNKIAGPYYRSGKNREIHRECEAYQDYFLYQEVYRIEQKSGKKYDFFSQDFHKWADCIKAKTTRNTEDWFRYFLQRGFIETYGVGPTEQEIEDSVDNLLITLRVCKKLGPYEKAAMEYKEPGRGINFQKYIEEAKYLDFYKEAVDLTVVYIKTLYKAYDLLSKGKDFGSRQQRIFLKIVSDADLSSALQKNILAKASLELKQCSRFG